MSSTETALHPEFDLIESLHDECPGCDREASEAAGLASATGSVGATHQRVDGRTGVVEHSARVRRVRCHRSGTDCLCPVCRNVEVPA